MYILVCKCKFLLLFLCFMYGLVPPGLLGRTVLVHWMDPQVKEEINK